MITETVGVAGMRLDSILDRVDRQRFRPDVDQRDSARARAGAQEMLAEHAAHLRFECFEVARGERCLGVPTVFELSVAAFAEKIRLQVGAIVSAEWRRLAKD